MHVVSAVESLSTLSMESVFSVYYLVFEKVSKCCKYNLMLKLRVLDTR